MTGLLLLLVAALGGAAAVSRLDPEAPLGLRLGGGAALGLSFASVCAYPVAAAAGMGAGVAAAFLAGAAPLALLLRPRRRAALVSGWRAAPRPSLAEGLALAALGLLLARVFARAMFLVDGAIVTGVDHDLGDLPFHLGIVEGFLRGENFRPGHPELAGVRLTYPFLADFLAALLARAGLRLDQAVTASNIALVLALLVLLHALAAELTRDRLAAALSPLLFFLSGGLGFLRLLGQVDPEQGLLALLAHLPHDATITWDGRYRWGNVVITLLMPQRSMLLGLPLALVVITCWWRALHADDPAQARGRMRLAALGLGLSPLAHAHTFTVLVAVGAALALLFRDRWRLWAAFFGPALALAVPQALWLARGSVLRARDFLAFAPGWDHGTQPILSFWLANTGLFLPLLAAALLWRGKRPLLDGGRLRFYAPFLACFVVPNLLRLSPWIWDNVKFLVFWHLASVPLVALVLSRLARGAAWRTALAAMLALLLVLSGGLDLWRVASGQIAHEIFPRPAVAFADAVAEAAPPGSVLVSAPVYDAPALLSGRPLLFGYPGHMWSQGLGAAVGTREADLATIYGGDSAARDLLARYGVGYVVLGPQERRAFQVNEEWLGRLAIAAEVGPYRLLRAPNPRAR